MGKETGPIQLGFQMEFSSDGAERFILPPRLLELEEVSVFLDWARKRRLWREIDEEKFLIADLRYRQCLSYKDQQWQPQIPLAEFPSRRVSALLILIPSLTPANRRSLESEIVQLSQTCLVQHRSALFIYEERGNDTDTKWRNEILKKAELAKANILTPKNEPYIFWEARRPKERLGVNLTLKPWFWPMFQRTIESYKHLGWEVVIPEESGHYTSFISLADLMKRFEHDFPALLRTDYELPEILVRAQHSTFVPGCVGDLKDGRGVWLRNTSCGKCIWQISLKKGMVTKMADCGERDCQAPEPFQIKKRYFLGQTIETEVECCGSRRVINCQLIKRGQNFSHLLIELSCPHCGNPFTRKEWIDNREIEF